MEPPSPQHPHPSGRSRPHRSARWRLARWLPAVVVLVGALIYAWVVGGAPGTVWLTGPKIDLPAGAHYPGRDHLERVDPMGPMPEAVIPEADGEVTSAAPGSAAPGSVLDLAVNPAAPGSVLDLAVNPQQLRGQFLTLQSTQASKRYDTTVAP